MGCCITEFDLIEAIKNKCETLVSNTILGIGDDAAIVQPNPSAQLVISTDTLVEDVHFKASDPPDAIGHKALAVNLSDMAAMAATPKWALLNLTLPKIDKKWLNGFIKGFATLSAKHKVQLIGGDTTQGPLNIAVTVMGETPRAIRRDGAQTNDLIVLTGEVGSAAFALQNPRRSKECNNQLKKPEPRLDIASKVSEIATAMIDVSDGLLADLGHICLASDVAAVIELTQIPTHPIVRKNIDWKRFVLAGGDDYQLCFTINIEDEDKLPDDCHIIGQILANNASSAERVMVLNQHQPMETDFTGYQHFNDD